MMIREAKETDLPTMVEIYNVSRGGAFSTNTTPATVAGSTGWFRQHKAAGRPVLVAEEEGRVIGWLSIRPFYRRPAYDATAKVIVYVAPEARGRGVGTELLSSAISRAPSAGVRALVCYLLSNNVPARRLFEDSGFQKWGEFPAVAKVGDKERDLVVLGKRL
jgi:L-amino acid N-acyltransferase YncA